jgi:hypothetical protein
MARTSQRLLRTAATALPSLFCDALGLAGASGVAYGAWLVYPPAGFMVGGALMIAGAVLFGRRADAESSS